MIPPVAGNLAEAKNGGKAMQYGDNLGNLFSSTPTNKGGSL